MGQLSKYSYTNAKIRAMLSYLIEPAVFDQLQEAKDMEVVLQGLGKTSYRELIAKHAGEPDLAQLESDLLKNDISIHQRVVTAMTTAVEKRLVNTLLERYEIEQLKVVLRIWHKKAPVNLRDYLLNVKISHEIDYEKIVNAPNIEEIILLLDGTPYMKPLLNARDRYKTKGSVFYLEVALDIDFYERLNAIISELSPIDQGMAKAILGVEIDIENIRWLIRFRKYYALPMGEILEWVIPGGDRINKDSVRSLYVSDGLGKVIESVSLGPYAKIRELTLENAGLLESVLYEILQKQIKRAMAGFPFTIGTVLGYLVLKRKETQNLQALLYGKSLGWKKEDLAAVMGH